jgi:hypothetical protein
MQYDSTDRDIWAMSVFDCDNNLLFSDNRDFLKLEYIYRKTNPKAKTYDVIWGTEKEIIRHCLFMSPNRHPNISPLKFNAIIDMIYQSKVDDSEYDIFDVRYRRISNLFTDMLKYNRNDTIRVLFETDSLYNSNNQRISELNDFLSNFDKPYYYIIEDEIVLGFRKYKVTIGSEGEPILQFVLQFKDKDTFARIVGLELIDKDKIEVNPTFNNIPPPPPPPPVVEDDK